MAKSSKSRVICICVGIHYTLRLACTRRTEEASYLYAIDLNPDALISSVQLLVSGSFVV